MEVTVLMLEEITEDFLQTSKNIVEPMRNSKFAQYSKEDRQARRKEAFRLHFELEYPAVKIAELMKINRNTINADIKFLYSQLAKDLDSIETDNWINRQYYRLEMQRNRLLLQLEKTDDISDKMGLERIILDIDTKLINIPLKIEESAKKVHKASADIVNDWMKQNNAGERLLTFEQLFRLPTETFEQVNQIILEQTSKPVKIRKPQEKSERQLESENASQAKF